MYFKTSFLLALLFTSSSAYAARGSDGSGWLIVVGIVIICCVVGWINTQADKRAERIVQNRMTEISVHEQRQRAYSETEHAKRLKEVDDRSKEIDEKESRERTKTEKQAQAMQKAIEGMEQAFSESYIQGRKWLAELIAEAMTAKDLKTARSLEKKKHPALKAADEVREVRLEKKEILERAKFLEYVLKTYHEYYPALEDYYEDILNENASLVLDEDTNPDFDRVSTYISKEEYSKLRPSVRNQLALDNWKKRKKSNVEIGRMFERYIGYLYEKDSWDVAFFGATEGLEDMGRDLICTKSNHVKVIQAKFWAKHRTIREKHIFQLSGTTILLPMTKPMLRTAKIEPVFCTTTVLSDTAKWAAEKLGVKIEMMDMKFDYPLIKCNINGKNNIYHLPFDQQYDRVKIDPAKGECYVHTTAEAERLGFRRAMKYVPV